MSRRTATAAAFVGVMLVGLIAYGLAQDGERSLPLHECPTLENCSWSGPEEFQVRGRIIADSWSVAWPTDRQVTFRLGGAWDLLQMRLAHDSEHPICFLVYMDGQYDRKVTINPGQDPQLLGLRVSGKSSLQFKMPNDLFGLTQIRMVSPRLISGKAAERSTPTELNVVDGQIIYIEAPGAYRIRIRH
ncbi:hypothetical protein LLH23_11850 [bacterium]|nr:hypothetical protein [bacterium]